MAGDPDDDMGAEEPTDTEVDDDEAMEDLFGADDGEGDDDDDDGGGGGRSGVVTWSRGEKRKWLEAYVGVGWADDPHASERYAIASITQEAYQAEKEAGRMAHAALEGGGQRPAAGGAAGGAARPDEAENAPWQTLLHAQEFRT